MKDPDVDKIIKERNARETHYGALHEIQKNEDDFYELTYNAGIPDNLAIDQKNPKAAREWVEAGVRHFTMDNPRAFVPPQTRSDRARERAATLETFYNSWLERLTIQLKQSARKLLKRGELFYKLWIDDFYYAIDKGAKNYKREDIEDRALTHFPLLVSLPDPINILCSPAHNILTPTDVIEYYGITVAEVENMCDRNNWKWSNPKNKSSTDKVKWTSYYDDEKRCFLIDDIPILTPEIQVNILGFCPYIHVPSGLGDTNYEGKPEYLYRSIIYGNKEMIELWTRALNQMDAITARHAWPRPKLHGTSEESIRRLYADGFSMDPSKPILETDDVQVTFEQGQSAPPQAYQHLAMLQEQAEPPPYLAGGSATGVYSGVDYQTRSGMARSQYKDPLKNLEDGLALLLGMGARALDTVIKHPISVRDVDIKDRKSDVKTISPDDIKGYYYVKVGMKAELPEATDMRKTIGMNAHKAGIVSLKRVLMEYFDMSAEESDDEVAEMLKEKFLNNPVTMEAVIRVFAERWGMEIVPKILDEMGMESSRGGSRRQPENIPEGIEGIRSRDRTGGFGIPGKAEVGTMAGEKEA